MKPLLELLEKRSLPHPRKQLKVEFSELGDRSTVLGAASFAVAKFLRFDNGFGGSELIE